MSDAAARPRRAVALTPMETRPNVIVRIAGLADELGYEMILVPEGWGLDSTVVLTQIALSTRRIRFASSIQSIWARTAATMAMTAATLDQLSGGRYICGLGASTPGLAEGFHDVPFEQPAERLRTMIDAVRRLLAGERAMLQHRTTHRPLRLGTTAAPHVPILAAALGPATRRVAAESADAWNPVMTTPSWLTSLRPVMAEQRSRAGDRREPLTVISGPGFAAVGDPTPAEAAAAFYITAMGDVYANVLTRQGFGEAVAALRRDNPHPDPRFAVVSADARPLLDQLTVAGAPDHIRDRLAEWQLVVDIVSVGVNPGADWRDIEGQLEAGAPQ